MEVVAEEGVAVIEIVQEVVSVDVANVEEGAVEVVKDLVVAAVDTIMTAPEVAYAEEASADVDDKYLTIW